MQIDPRGEVHRSPILVRVIEIRVDRPHQVYRRSLGQPSGSRLRSALPWENHDNRTDEDSTYTVRILPATKETPGQLLGSPASGWIERAGSLVVPYNDAHATDCSDIS